MYRTFRTMALRLSALAVTLVVATGCSASNTADDSNEAEGSDYQVDPNCVVQRESGCLTQAEVDAEHEEARRQADKRKAKDQQYRTRIKDRLDKAVRAASSDEAKLFAVVQEGCSYNWTAGRIHPAKGYFSKVYEQNMYPHLEKLPPLTFGGAISAYCPENLESSALGSG